MFLPRVLEDGDLAKPMVPFGLDGALYGASYWAEASWTPAAAAYTAGDVMDTVQQFAFQDRYGNNHRGGTLLITTVLFWVYHTAVISGETSYITHLYAGVPPTALADNDAFDLASGNRAAHRGAIDLGTPTDRGSTLFVETNQYNKHVLVPATGILHAHLRTIGGFTATAAARRVMLIGLALN